MTNPRKRALLIVDVQNGFCPGGNLPVPDGDQIIPIINAMTASGYYDIVITSQDWHPAGHGSFASSHPGKNVFDMGELGGQPQVMWPDHCVQDSADAAFHPDLDLSKVVYVQQKGTDPAVDSYSAFRDNAADKHTGLHDWLHEQDIYILDVCGLATDYCVKATALDATLLRVSARVRFIEDASRGITPEGVAEALKEMEEHGVEIIDSSVATSPTGYRSESGFGEVFHTALRKGSGTKWSGLLWNIINIMGRIDDAEDRKNRVWPHFVRSCEKNWRLGMKPSKAVKAWAELDNDYKLPSEDRGPHTSIANAFRTMIELCDQETWDDVDTTIEYWVDKDEAVRRDQLAKV